MSGALSIDSPTPTLGINLNERTVSYDNGMTSDGKNSVAEIVLLRTRNLGRHFLDFSKKK
jgi:hypothetical protein